MRRASSMVGAFAGALLLTLASGAAQQTTTWRLVVGGTSCEELLGADDYVPINVTHGDFFVADSLRNRTEVLLAENPGCTVLDRHQGRPGREFLVPDGYIPPEEMMRIFELLALEHPALARLIDLTAEFGTPPTTGGSHIYALKISENVAQDEDEPNVLLVGMHHAREIMGPETVLVVARYMLEDGRDDPRVRRLLSGNQVYLAWDWNPDGWNYVFDVDNNWRKNRLPNPDGSFGVDLNRNYPFGWDFSCGGSTQMSSNSYRGPSAASEPEIQTMIAWQGSRKFAKIVDLHSFGRDVRQNYAACAALPDEIDSMYTEIVSVVAADMEYIPVRSCCSGGEISFAFSTHGTMSILFEQGRSFQPSYEDTMEELETENLPGILNFFELPIPASGHVRNVLTGEPVEGVSLRTTAFGWNFDEGVTTNAFGRFHMWVPTGTWQVNVTVSGYAAVTVDVEASRESGVETEIFLTPAV